MATVKRFVRYCLHSYPGSCSSLLSGIVMWFILPLAQSGAMLIQTPFLIVFPWTGS